MVLGIEIDGSEPRDIRLTRKADLKHYLMASGCKTATDGVNECSILVEAVTLAAINVCVNEMVSHIRSSKKDEKENKKLICEALCQSCGVKLKRYEEFIQMTGMEEF